MGPIEKFTSHGVRSPGFHANKIHTGCDPLSVTINNAAPTALSETKRVTHPALTQHPLRLT